MSYGGRQEPLDEICESVGTPEEFLIWENLVKDIIGSQKKIRQMKLKELGL